MGAQSQYRSYLLRVWRLTTAEGLAWRIVLQDVLSMHQLTFTSLAEAMAFLEQQLEFELGNETHHQPEPGPNEPRL